MQLETRADHANECHGFFVARYKVDGAADHDGRLIFLCSMTWSISDFRKRTDRPMVIGCGNRPECTQRRAVDLWIEKIQHTSLVE
nr:hypothetical protein [Marinicella sp. NBU2979]